MNNTETPVESTSSTIVSTPIPDPQLSTPPVIPSTPPPTTPPKGKGPIYFILGATLLIFFALLAFIVFTVTKEKNQKVTNNTAPVITAAPTVRPILTEEEEINTIDVGDIQKDLSDIDTDVQQL